jgi:parallel beta-helix repeat protein
MTALSIQPPFPIFTDTDGSPLENGYIWIGVANLPPIGNPIAVYWDAALTQPAALPVRTRGGYPVNAGTPARLYVGSDYSIQVQNKNGSVIYSAPVATERLSSVVVTGIDSSEVSFLQAGTGAVTRTAQAKMRDVVSVKDFGAVGDGVTDDTVAIQAALDAANQYQTVFFPYGTYVISDELVINVDNILVTGRARINARAGAQFEFMLKATGRNGVTVENLKFDANKDARKATQSVRYMGVAFLGCTECQFLNLRVQGCLGYNNVSAVAIAAAGQSIRCRIDGCVMLDSGEAGLSPAKDADGIFTSGEQNVISNCIASNCTDTGFVIESSNQSVIDGCTASLCGAGGGITSANASDKSGNVISGLTVLNWYGSVGAIQIGIPGGYAGNLLNTVVSDVTVVAETPTYGGPGPAILVSGTAGFGEVQNLILSNVRVRGAATQGIIAQRGTAIHIHNAHITGTTDSCIQFQNGTEHRVTSSYLSGGSYGVISQNASEVFVSDCVIRNSTSNGLNAFDTSTLYQKSNIVKGTAGASMTKDSGATLGFTNIDIPYSASMTPDATSSDCFTITVTNTTAFTINTPTKGNRGQILTLTIKNASGGAMGTITWGAAYYMSAWTNPANGQNRSISFRFDGSAWVQISQTGVDVPN